ncbi:MAG: class D sortase [Clostridia bacterium]|jgi:LPXTG-site transpeptidase (sortase) family protein|nr:class D sortase [Clostridia bacterium]
MFKRSIVLVELNSNNINQETKEEKNNDYSDTKVKNNETKEKEKKETNWKIIIPKISLEAEICEGTSKKVMDEYIGHFEETSLKNGNVGLAAHNRGYEVNYFANIKKLQIGDEIIYKYYDFEKTYKVSKNIIITDEDWSYLEETEENTITLITCIENQPEYRRCVQAIENSI